MYKLIVKKRIYVARFFIYIMIVLSVASGSCSARQDKLDQKKLIPEKDFIMILTDIHIANGLLAIPKINARYSVLDSISTYFQVIEKYGYTKEEMDKTMKYYFIKNPKKLNEIFDQVLVTLSKRESGIEKESLLEQNRKSNRWRGRDFFAEPSESGSDSTRFDFNFTETGYYILNFTSTVYPDDESLNPRPIIYSTLSDSVDTEKRTYLKSTNYLKDGQPHNYSIILTDPKKKDMHIRGWFFDSDKRQNKVVNHFKIENISIMFSPALL